MRPSGDSEAIEAEAADWFARQRGEHWTSADEAAFEAWLNTATAHRIAFVRLDAAWQHSARLRALGAGVSPGVIPERGSWTFSPFFGQAGSGAPQLCDPTVTRRPSRIAALAASVLVILAGASGWFLFAKRAEVYSTAVGHTDTIPLRDGTRVTLNTDSRIRIALNETERRIEIDRGEAFFDVAKDQTRPFVVVAGAKRVIAIGTRFSVRRTHDDVVIVVTEGRVRLDADGSGPETQLDAGTVAQTRKSAVWVQRHNVAEAEQILSWRRGYVTFRDASLEDAVAEFNRYSARKIRIHDPAINSIRIGGNFRTDDTEAFLWLLENRFPVQVRQETDEVVLTHR